ncbi:MAG: lipopolysaccharide biosynthesis protein [Dysgonamonadaceae bacterium]|jgi:O-antigen/teichoic acid export membrane protein|nr:lipopolysaccharide biosynthesis protein [Dysgonamonadaceae bacterium]
MASGLKQKTAKGLFWGGFSNSLQQLLAMGFGIVAARLLSDGDYGLIAMLGIFNVFASIIINGGFSIALINKQDATDRDYNAVFWFALLTAIVLSIILCLGAPLIAWWFNEPALIPLARVLFAAIPIGCLGIVPATILSKQLKIKQQAVIDISSLIVSVIVGIIIILNGGKYWGLAVQGLIAGILYSIVRLIIVPWKPSLKIDFTPLKTFFSFSIKIVLTGIFQQINTSIFSLILGKYFGKNILGQFDRGQSWVVKGNALISGMINYVTQPVLAQLNDDRQRQVKILRKLIRFGAFVSFPLMLGLAFVGKEFIIITIGEKWLPSVLVMQLFCLSGCIGFLCTLFSNLIYTRGKSNIYMNVTAGIGIAQIIIAIVLSPWGIISMLTGYLLVYFAGLFVWHHYVYQLIGLRIKDVLKDILPYLGIVLVCLGIAWLVTLRIEHIILLFVSKVIIFAILYIFMLRICNSTIFNESVGFFRNKGKEITK